MKTVRSECEPDGQHLATGRLRCTVAFFGIDRRLDLTGQAIIDRIVAPADRFFKLSSVGFLWAPESIFNPRSGEDSRLVQPRFDCLPPGDYYCAPPIDLTEDRTFKQLKGFGDTWGDKFRSLANLYLQLSSLIRTTEMALRTEPDIVVFLRPDLFYHDDFTEVFRRAGAATPSRVFIPHWQPHSGLNDRFAICAGTDAIRAYGTRLNHALEFCEKQARSLHSERLLRYSLARRGVHVQRIRLRASRIRVNGSVRKEDFSYFGWKPALRVLGGSLRRRIISLSGRNARSD